MGCDHGCSQHEKGKSNFSGRGAKCLITKDERIVQKSGILKSEIVLFLEFLKDFLRFFPRKPMKCKKSRKS